MNLNENQMKAVTHYTGPLLVIAGPGSGKTTVITYRIYNLIKAYGVLPSEILVITFTKAATNEMSRRFLQMTADIEDGSASQVTFSTFHALFFKIIRGHYGYTAENIFKENERQDVIKNILHIMRLETEENFISSVSNEISMIKNEMYDLKHYNSPSLSTEIFLQIYNEYEDYKHNENKIDFDDILVKCYELLKNNDVVLKRWQNKYKFILIDEFQDINNIQYECMRMLSQQTQNIAIVGDDDQSVYKFRGARPEFLHRFEKDFENTTKVFLDTNYRSTDEIISVCNDVISENKTRFNKQISGTSTSGGKLLMLTSSDMGQEAKRIASSIKAMEKNGADLNEIAVIYRTNIQSRSFVDAFMNFNIPYRVREQTAGIYEHWITKDIYAYFKLALDRDSDEYLQRIINRPNRYISKVLINSARKCPDGILSFLLTDSSMKSWQISKIDEMMFYLNSLSMRNPYDAIKYIRQAVSYDEYIKEYATFRKMNTGGLFEIMNELQEAAKEFATLADYIKHVDEAIEEARASKNRINSESGYGVTLTTMHGAKGLEFTTVFVVSVVEGVIPHEKCGTQQEMEEERRLFYVAMTRAKRNLCISVIKSRYEKDVKPSRFLKNVKVSEDEKKVKKT